MAESPCSFCARITSSAPVLTYHIHITGIVQGVGFRPFVCRLAQSLHLEGRVCNENDGVHIAFNAASEAEAESFYQQVLSHPPPNAFIDKHSIKNIGHQKFHGFSIVKSNTGLKPDLLLTPDIAICDNCRAEIADPNNSRFQYAFTTCLQCGPRYSIISALPYDRENTTMAPFEMCADCSKEYNDIYDRRHYSQTNSCPACTIPLHLFDKNGEHISDDPQHILEMIQQLLEEGKIIAVKGIGGYLLMCDAGNEASVRLLRKRKQRPAKPFALMYDSVEDARQDLRIRELEEAALLGREAPIVLCRMHPHSSLPHENIAGGLNKLGVFLPYSPLLKLITSRFKKPLIATSGNLSGAPIIYKDSDALQWLGTFADCIVNFEREIVAPQDDSVIQFTEQGYRIVLRRSRGLAPNYFPNPLGGDQPVLAMGAELKSAFALRDEHYLYVSQFLGDQQSFESNESYTQTLQHLQHLLHLKPSKIVVDKHPQYHVSIMGREMARKQQLPIAEVQHHKAHFAAVLGEHQLFSPGEKILGVIWDGTGYGDDGQVWGGEFFLWEGTAMNRVAHLAYFPHLVGDKMSLEPRISALALLHQHEEGVKMIGHSFNKNEFDFYNKMLQRGTKLSTSSMGRFLDGIAAVLGILQTNSYEGEAAMKLEVAASGKEHFECYPVYLHNGELIWRHMLQAVVDDKNQNVEIDYIARKVFVSLVRMIQLVAEETGVRKIAFSGGVFQNALLVDIVEQLFGGIYDCFWHKQLSPNDECIGFGQLVYEQLEQNKVLSAVE